MKKIDRRDYLKRLGASVGAIAGAKLNTFAQRPKRSGSTQRKPKLIKHGVPPSILNWPITHTPPSLNPFVTAIFSGLMGFSYDQNSGEGLVGFHPGHGDHNLDVKIYQNPGCQQTMPPPPLPNNIKTVNLKIIGSSGKVVEYFQTVDDPFDRDKGHDNDFRWLPDLDSADFYPEGYGKNQHFNTILRIRNATFYTRVRTNSTFYLVNADNNGELRRFGHVALYMAAAMEVVNTDYVSLQINNETPIELHPGGGHTYQIVFSNLCSTSGSACAWEIDNDDETRRNDFHFIRKVLKAPNDRIKYSLRIDEQATTGAKPTFCPDFISRNTDEAPCMGGSYGQGNMG